ncbi:MAG: PHB depolymerase family esterase [Pararhizobium sp.]|nr:PHB depolymerase family esterase [Pararhizobium sp.]
MPLSRLLHDQQRWGRILLKAAKLSSGVLDPAPKRRAPIKKAAATAERLQEVASFGTNPGRLRMLRYVPPALPRRSPLVVVLHGCHQSAEEYDHHSGWSTLARERGFALVYAEQTRSNNGNLCFNWFRPSNVTRDRGEVMSIRQMIGKMATAHAIDKKRIFITGLSAGGAMTASMLAAYPELFAGGGIIAGLPHGAARDVSRALDAMNAAPIRTPEEWGNLVRAASPSLAHRPTVSIWHGTKDRTVSISNARALLDQWLDIYNLDATAFVETTVDGHARRVWLDKKGRPVIELTLIDGMGHGTPLRPRAASRPRADTPGRFMLDAGISSTTQLAKTWGLRKPSLLATIKGVVK